MSKIKPMELIARMSGKVCGHSNTYFAYRNGTHYTGTICNPCTKEPTEKQMEVRRRFAQIYLEMKQLTEEEKTMYEIEFKSQKKYKTLRGYIFAELYKQAEQVNA